MEYLAIKKREYPNSTYLNYETFYKNKKYNHIRRLKIIIISDILGNYKFYKEKTYEEKIKIIRLIELSCLNKAIKKSKKHNIYCVWSNDKYCNIYHSICYTIMSNLDSSSSVNSTSLIKMIADNKINLIKIAEFDPKEMCPEKYIKLYEEVDKRNKTEKKLKYSELYYCRKCKKNQCTLEKRYNRSFDEGVNLTINCLFCGHSWCA